MHSHYNIFWISIVLFIFVMWKLSVLHTYHIYEKGEKLFSNMSCLNRQKKPAENDTRSLPKQSKKPNGKKQNKDEAGEIRNSYKDEEKEGRCCYQMHYLLVLWSHRNVCFVNLVTTGITQSPHAISQDI